MNCLNKLLSYWKSFLKNTNDNSVFDENEPLARFLTEKHKKDKCFDESKRLVLPKAFQPANKTNDLSVYRIKGCPEVEIWQIADQYVTAKMPNKPKVLARAEVSVLAVESCSLTLDPDGYPHPRHVNIKDWPNDIRKKEITVELANKAILKMRT